LKQSLDENRNLEETLSRSWDVLANLPKGELTKIKDKNIQMYYKEGSKNIKQ
jgi:V/A-type H+-transporting ATPase subunit B